MRTVLVTGSTDGIGLATSRSLFQSGNKILVHGRTQEKAKFAIGKILVASGLKENSTANKLVPVWGDFSHLKEVVELSHQVQTAAPDLDVLINNAGVYMDHRALTADGFEMTFGVNHLAPFLLTHHLLPLLKSRPSARIVNVASVAHQRASLDLNNLQSEKHFDGYEAYSVSKLCNILFTRALAALLKNTNVTVNCLHPGVIDTKLLRAGFSIQGETVDQGAQTSVFLALDPSVEKTTGTYFINCKASFPSRLGQDDNLAVKLWKKTEDLLKPWL